MPKSIRTTSNTQNTTNSTPAIFKAGDAVLCPSLGYGTKPFILHKYEYHSELLCIHAHHSSIAFDSKGYFITAGDAQRGDIETNDYAPSLFIDTPENRQIITALCDQVEPTPSQRKIIDTTSQDDDEVVILPAQKLANMAFDIEHAAETLSDIGTTLALIHCEKVDKFTAQPLARLAHSSADTWEEILHRLLDSINDTLATTRYGKEGK